MSFLRGAIFDLDGVLVNTVTLHFKAWKKMFDEYETEFDFSAYKAKVDGISRLDGARAVLSNISKHELDKAAARKQGYFLDFVEKEGIKPYKSSIELIKELRKKKIKIGVISASRSCHLILEKAKLLDLIDTEVNGNHITRSKPDPQVFLMALEKLELCSDECIAFEDAALGVEAAKRADLVTVGVDRYRDSGRLKKADLVVRDLSLVTFIRLQELLAQKRKK
ncbi:HAD family hydrolase [Candidatus Omnitrophota bacterium]